MYKSAAEEAQHPMLLIRLRLILALAAQVAVSIHHEWGVKNWEGKPALEISVARWNENQCWVTTEWERSVNKGCRGREGFCRIG